jgi:phage-related protein
MTEYEKKLPAAFYQTTNGREPVREWLKVLEYSDRKTIGMDIATLEFCWPVGLPQCRPITGRKGLWEVRSNLSGGRIARILFGIHAQQMVLLHGFVKKTKKTPEKEIDLAMTRFKEVQHHA